MPVNPCFAKYFPQLVKADRDLIRESTQEYIKKGMEDREAATKAVQDKLDSLDADKRSIHEQLIKEAEKRSPELLAGLKEKYAPKTEAPPTEAKKETGDLAELQKDLKDTEARMDRRREAYLKKQMAGETTRAQTTTYNADMGNLAERRDELKRMIKDRSEPAPRKTGTGGKPLLAVGAEVLGQSAIQNSNLSDDDKKKYSTLLHLGAFAGVGMAFGKSEAGKGIREMFEKAKAEWLEKGPRSSYFKEWFGDWQGDPKGASKVVDEQGNPLKVFSGHSNAPLYKNFDPKKGTAGGFYASEDPAIASNYALGKFGTKEYYENAAQYRLQGKNGEFNKKVWQVELTPEHKTKLDALKVEVNKDGDHEYEISQMDDYIKSNAPFDKDARRWQYRGGSDNLQNIWEFYEQMGYNIAYAKDVEGKPFFERQEKTRFEELLDKLDIPWQSYDWNQPGVFPVYLNIRNPLDADKPFPPALLSAIKDRAKGERNIGWEEAINRHWTKDYPLKEWVKDIENGSEGWTTQVPKKALPILKEFGYDGIKERGNKGSNLPREQRGINWIAFDPEQIKSATANKGTFDPKTGNMLLATGLSAAGNVATEMSSLSDDEKKRMHTLFNIAGAVGIVSAGMGVAPGFFSKLRNTISEMPKMMEGSAFERFLENKGVKKDEVKWSLGDFLEENKGKAITKEQAQKAWDAGHLEVHEVIKGEPIDVPKPEWKTAHGSIFIQGKGVRIEELPNGKYQLFTPGGTTELFEDLGLAKQEGEATAQRLERYQAGERDTKFSSYQLPGSQEGTYRELLLTLPEKDPASMGFDISPVSASQIKVTNKLGSEVFRGTQQEWRNSSLYKGIQQNTPDAFRSSHFDEPNIVSHIRFNDREIDGKKTLFIEEVQSDWHQKGRKEGYQQPVELKQVDENNWQDSQGYRIKKTPAHLNFIDSYTVYQPNTESPLGIRDSFNAAKQLISQPQGGVPDAPFKSTWQELAFKRMVRYAAENGYDRIGWTTGEQQAARYDLSKQVKEIKVNRSGPIEPNVRPPVREVMINLTSGSYYSLIVDDAGKVIQAGTLTGAQGKPISEVVGKEVAEKIMATQGREVLTGPDLKVGGEGMKGFYDKILVDYANKLGKQWGAKVEEREIPKAGGQLSTSQGMGRLHEGGWAVVNADGDLMYGSASRGGAEEWLAKNNASGNLKIVSNDLPSTQTEPIHTLPVTPEMKKSVMETGQPLFSLAPAAGIAAINAMPGVSDDTKKKITSILGPLAMLGMAYGGVKMGLLGEKALNVAKEIEAGIKDLAPKEAAEKFAADLKSALSSELKDVKPEERAELLKMADKKVFDKPIALEKQAQNISTVEKPSQVNPPVIEKSLGIRQGQSKNWLQKFGFKLSDADAILKAKGPFGQPFLREPTPKGEMPRELKLSWIDPKQKIDTDIKGISDFADWLHGKDVPLFNKAFDRMENTARLARKTLSPGVVFRHVFKDDLNNPINDALEAQQSSFVNRKEGEAFIAKTLNGVSSSKRRINQQLQKLRKEYMPIYGEMLQISHNDGGRMVVMQGMEEEAKGMWDRMQPLLEQRDAIIKELAKTEPDVRIYLMAEDPKAEALTHATPKEIAAARQIREYLNGPVKQSLQKVGIRTLGEDKIYLTHLMDKEDLPSLDIGHFDYIPEDFQFKHRELAGKSWMPSIVETTRAYVPRMSRMVSWNPFINKWGPFMKYMTDHPDVRSYFEDWLGSNYYDKGKGTTAALFDHAVNGYVEFEALRLLGGSLSSAKSHAFKVAGNLARAPMPIFLQSMARTLGSVLNIIPERVGWTEKSLGQKLAQEFVARKSLYRMIDEVPTDKVNKLYDAAQKYSNTIAPVEWFENVNDALGTIISSSNAGLDPIATRQFLWDTISRFNFRGGVDQPMAMKQAPYRAVFQFQMTPWKIKEMQANLFMQAIRGKKDPVGDPYAMKLFRYLSAVGIITTLGYKAGYNLLDYFTHIPLTRMGAGGVELGQDGIEVSQPKFAVTPAVQLAYDMGQKGIFSGAMSGSSVKSDITKAVTPLTAEKLMRINKGDIPKIYEDSPLNYLLSLPTMKAQEEAKKHPAGRSNPSGAIKRPSGPRRSKKIASNDYLGMLAGEGA